MNEDGNNFAPQGPIFSSPDTPPANPNPAPAPQAPVTPAPAPAPAPEQPTYTNPFATTEIPAEPAAPAAPIVSTPQEPANSTRHMFNSRRFKDTQAQAAPTQFAGAPDFFNQAAAQNAPSTGDIVIGDQPQRSGGKGKMIAVVAVILLLIGGGVAAYFVMQGSPVAPGSNSDNGGNNAASEEKTADDLISEVYQNYTDLLDDYYSIGANPSVKLQKKIEKQTFFLLVKKKIDSISENIEGVDKAITAANDKVNTGDSKAVKKYKSIKPKIDNTVAVIKENINTIKKFYDAFAEPLYDYIDSSEEKSTCELSSKANELLASSDAKIKTAAEAYKKSYCAVYARKKLGADKAYEEVELASAKKALVDTLKAYDENADGQAEIRKNDDEEEKNE